MPDLWLDVDAALAEVPVNILPLIDDTDFKAREVSVAYNQAGMDLVWNFVTTAGATTQTAVTPTTGGDYDWAHQGDGMYSIEIPASGGASINNDTEGFGWFTGYATGVLPWRGPTIGFRAAALNNVLIDSAYSATRGLAGTALPDAVADAAGGLPISDAGGLDLDTQLGTDIDAILADTNELQGDDVPGLISTHDGKLDTVDGIVDTILVDTNELQTDWANAGRLDALIDLILADTGELQTDWVNAGRLDAILDLILADTSELQTDDIPGAIATHDGKLDTVDGIVDNILVDTAVIGALGAGLTAIPWNAAWDAEAQSEVADALAAFFTSAAQLVDDIWDEVLTGATHNVNNSAGKRLRSIDAAFEVSSGTARAGTSTTITLAADESATDNIYNGDRIVIVGGTGQGEHSIATDYDGTSKVATMSKAWVVTPDATSEYEVVPADTDLETWNNVAVTSDGDWNELQTDVDAILVDTNELQTDWTNAGRLDALIDLILADTGELQTDLTNGGRLDLLVDAIKAKTDNLPADPADDSDIDTQLATIVADTNELQGDWANAGRLDTILDAILADTGTDGVAVATATAQAIADEILKRGVSNVEDAADAHSLATIILAILESSLSGTTWTIKKTGGTTFTTKTVTVDAAADPITAVT